ncbi:hypothetical protein D9611_009985 [Ephemerocybe angulata]|uniref:Uncharacterized protein n=1 Tax=Ephemerocybe angulata TaxID=980116 RepID=A0A8H5FFW9_9AGAR|nr:hypothetical protein D9611_009985 [Tulosesus angulatus]
MRGCARRAPNAFVWLLTAKQLLSPSALAALPSLACPIACLAHPSIRRSGASFHATRRLPSTHASRTRPPFHCKVSITHDNSTQSAPPRPRTALKLTHSHDARGNGAKTKMAVRGTKAPPPLTQPAALPPLRPNPSIRRSDASRASLHATRRQPAPPFDASIVHSGVPPPLHDLNYTPPPRTRTPQTQRDVRLRWPAEPTADMHEHLAQRPTLDHGEHGNKLVLDETHRRRKHTRSEINDMLAPARAVDPTPPQLPSTMAVRRAVAGLSCIEGRLKTRTHRPMIKPSHAPYSTTPHAIDKGRARDPSVEYAREVGYLSTPRANGSRNQDFRDLQKTADVCATGIAAVPESPENRARRATTAFPATQKSGQPTTLTEDGHPRAFLTDGVSFATCTNTTTTTPASQETSQRPSKHHTHDNGTPSLSSFRQRTGRPTKGECARNWIAGISKPHDIKRSDKRNRGIRDAGPSKQSLRRRLRQCQKLRQAVLDVRRKPFAAGRPRRRTTLEATADGTGQWDGRRRRLSLLQPNSYEAEMERDDPADTSDHTSDPPRRQHPTLNKDRTPRTLHHQNTVAGRRKSRTLPTDAALVFGSQTDWVVQGTGRVHRCDYKATRTPAAQAMLKTDSGLAGRRTRGQYEFRNAFNECYSIRSPAGRAKLATKSIRKSSLGRAVSGPGFVEREDGWLWCKAHASSVSAMENAFHARPGRSSFTRSGVLDLYGDGEGQDQGGLWGTEGNGVGGAPWVTSRQWGLCGPGGERITGLCVRLSLTIQPFEYHERHRALVMLDV